MLGTLADLQARVGGRVVGDGTVAIARVSAVDDASADALTFATDEKYYAAALASAAAAVLVDASVAARAKARRKPLLVVENARAALANFLATLKPPRPRGPFRHPSAVVEEGAHDRRRTCTSARMRTSARARRSGAAARSRRRVRRRRRADRRGDLAAPARDGARNAASSAIASCCTRAA